MLNRMIYINTRPYGAEICGRIKALILQGTSKTSQTLWGYIPQGRRDFDDAPSEDILRTCGMDRLSGYWKMLYSTAHRIYRWGFVYSRSERPLAPPTITLFPGIVPTFVTPKYLFGSLQYIRMEQNDRIAVNACGSMPIGTWSGLPKRGPVWVEKAALRVAHRGFELRQMRDVEGLDDEEYVPNTNRKLFFMTY